MIQNDIVEYTCKMFGGNFDLLVAKFNLKK